MDASGSPIPGAKVSRQASDCSTLTREDGRFDLRCEAGTWKISIHHPSFYSNTETVSVPNGSQLVLERSTLIQVPESDGLHLLRDASFVPLVPTTLERASNSNGEAKRRDFCVDRGLSVPNKVSSGTLRFLERSPTTPWRMFRMDPAGCAYKDSRNQEGRWVVEHRDRVSSRVETFGDHPGSVNLAVLRLVKVEAGEYFIAEWSGFFVPTGPKASTYKGYWVQVQD